MNTVSEIKELLKRYFDGESSDTEEQQLREYFTSDNISPELKTFRSIFAYLSSEKANPSEYECPVIPIQQHNRKIIWYAAAGIAACVLVAGFFLKEKTITPTVACTGTYVIVDGICYDDLSLVSKYATEAIDCVTEPINGNAAIDALDFLDVSSSPINNIQ